MTEKKFLPYIFDVCSKEFDTKRQLSAHRKGPGRRCGYVHDVPVPLFPLFPHHGVKRAASADAASNLKPQRKRSIENPGVHEEETNVMDIPENPTSEYRIMDDEYEELDSGFSGYRTFQEALYNMIFTKDCLACKNMDEFVALLKVNACNQRSERDYRAMSLYSALSSISRTMGDELLSILPELGCEKLFKKWETLKRHLHKSMKGLNKHKEYDFSWPENWKITDSEWKRGKPPPCMKILINDPLQQAALLLVDPRFMFFFKDQIKLEAKLDKTGKISDFMSTQLAHDTQEKLWSDRGFQGDKVYADYERDIVIALKLYEDGVSMGWGGAASTIAVMGAILNCDIDLQRRDISKFVIGYIDNLTSVSEEVIMAHLTSVVKMSLTTAKEELRFFQRKLEKFLRKNIWIS